MKARVFAIACAFAGAAAFAPQSDAQDYPVKPIRWVIPYSPGGASDITARTMAPTMGQALGQQVVVNNRAGGAAIPGFDIVAKAPPDGYTWVLANIAFGANPSLFKKLPFDVEKDFAPVTKLAVVPLVVTVHPSLPVKTLNELVALMRKNPGKINYASAGNGGANHLATEVFRLYTKVDIVHVPFKGGGPAVARTGRRADRHVVCHHQLLPCAHQGRTPARIGADILQTLRGVAGDPDAAGVGIEGLQRQRMAVPGGHGGTPRAVIDRLQKEAVATLKDPKVKARMVELGAETEGTTTEEAAAFLKSEWALWRKTVREAGIKTVD